MTIYRIARNEFADLDGIGAKLYGGRWNLPGYPAVYCGSSISSVLLERLTIDPELFSSERYVLYSTISIDCPDELIQKYSANELPKGWDKIPSGMASQQFGTKILKDRTLCFGVPSVVDPSSYNYVLNPLSDGFDQLKASTNPLRLDHRLVR